jgi:tRNA(Arg) A34 adenosine deaminase TadA
VTTTSIPSADDLGYLAAAVDQARGAREHGNHPFGAVLVTATGRILRAENTVVTSGDPTGHAETNLVRLAAARVPDELAGSVLYTSTEPCAMCSGAIFWAGIPTVFYALGGDELIELMPVGSDEFTLGVSAREVFARGGHPTTVHGPIGIAGAREVHDGFWV